MDDNRNIVTNGHRRKFKGDESKYKEWRPYNEDVERQEINDNEL